MKTLDELVALREKRKVALDKATASLKKVEEQIKSTCHHPEESVVDKNSYHKGSYYDTAYTDFWSECTICGKKSETKTKEHGWYG